MSKRDTQAPETGSEPITAAVDPKEADAIAASGGAVGDALAGAGGEEAETYDDRGQRVRRVITTKDFLPGGDTDFPRRVVGPSERGTRFLLGTLRGTINATERKQMEWQGKKLESVWLNGDFEAILANTGEVISAPTAILPKAFGYIIESALAGLDPGEQAELKIDCDIGLEATGKTIAYEWVVIYYREGKAQKAMREVRARSDARLARQKKQLLLPPSTPEK